VGGTLTHPRATGGIASWETLVTESRSNESTREPSVKDVGERRMAVALVLAVALVMGVLLVIQAAGTDPEEARSASGGPVEVVRPSVGEADAPIVIELFSDFACQFCRRHALEVEPRLIARWVDQGQVRIDWYDYPLQGEPSVRAALAGRAAALQGGFWAFQYEVFASGDLSEAGLRAAATRTGLDADRLGADMRRPELLAAVQADMIEGRSRRFAGTPSFSINGRSLVGFHTFEVFEQILAGELTRGD
jgi:protein-disulfide isomerase